MPRTQVARLLLTAILAFTSVSSFILDWRSNHLLNPAWHPHAKFHGELLLFFLAGTCATAIWLLWRKSTEPQTALQTAALISAAFWTPFLYAKAFLPEASLWAGPPDRVPQFQGMVYYPNVLTAVLFLILTAIAYWFARSADTESSSRCALGDSAVTTPQSLNIAPKCETLTRNGTKCETLTGRCKFR